MSDDSQFLRARKKLQIGEDFWLANELQQREFEIHYTNNRETNSRLVSDFKKSRQEQQKYGVVPQQQPTQDDDEKLAREIQEKINREEMEQIQRDQQLAWEMEQEANFGFSPTNPFVHDVAEFLERGQ